MSKNVFDIFKEIKEDDTTNGTSNLGLCTEVIELKEVKAGCKITIGAPAGTTNSVGRGDKMAVLLLIDRETYKKFEK